MLGTLLYSAFRNRKWMASLSGDPVLAGLTGFIVLLLHLGAPDILIVSVFAAFILVAVSSNGGIAEILNSRPLIWLGDISYSLYLIHGFVQYVASLLFQANGIAHPSRISDAGAVLITIAMLATSLSLAAASYYGIETVGRRYLRALFDVRPSSATADQLARWAEKS
jgi:peptidoglycan/LPS O-acetylase OafA/YrhL